MKKLILLMIFCLGLGSMVSAQTKYLTKQEFNSAIGNATSKADKIPFRITEITKSYSNKKLDGTTTFVRENIPPNKKRWNTTVEKNGIITEKHEFITIGTVEYSKNDNEDWKSFDSAKLDQGNNPKGSVKIGGALEIKELDEFINVPAMLGSQSTSLFYNFHIFQLDNILYILENRYWMNSDGVIVKSTSSQRNTTPDNIVEVGESSYEYNPKELKIEAPKIK
jgi:outer membrane lipoprotein-sorting protein